MPNLRLRSSFCVASLALLGAARQDSDVTGLRVDETVTVLQVPEPVSAAKSGWILRSRIVHASTNHPLAGVRVEAWTENTARPLGFEVCLARAVTQRDGTVELLLPSGAIRVEKMRLSKPGFASTTLAPADLAEQEVPLFPARPLEGRVLDLEGLPVAGARVRTRETCAHAIPAAETLTDARGRFRLEDCPPCENGPELEVVDAAHEPLRQLDIGLLREQASFYGSLDLYVARREPFEVRVVGADAAPMPFRRIVTKDAAMSEAWTDADGRCTLFPSPFGREVPLWICDSGLDVQLCTGVYPRGCVTTLAPASSAQDGPALTGSLRVTFEGLDGAARGPVVAVFCSSGRTFEFAAGEAKLPVGPARVVVGAAFHGWREEVREIEVTETALNLMFEPRREPFVRVKLPPGTALRIVAQAGTESLTHDALPSEDGSFGLHVPAGAPVTIFVACVDGELRRATLPPLERDAEVDLTRPSTILRHGANTASAQPSTVRFAITDRAGRPIDGIVGRIDAGPTSIGDEPAKSGSFTWTLPAHTAYRAAFHAPGWTTARIEGTVPVRADTPFVHVVLARRARLELRGAITSVEVGGPEAEAVAGGFDLDAAPGPLMLRLMRDGRPALVLDLVPNEGETRRIDVK